MDKTGRSCQDLAAWVKQSIKEGKASALKLDENVKAEHLDDMITVLSEAADKQVADLACAPVSVCVCLVRLSARQPACVPACLCPSVSACGTLSYTYLYMYMYIYVYIYIYIHIYIYI